MDSTEKVRFGQIRRWRRFEFDWMTPEEVEWISGRIFLVLEAVYFGVFAPIKHRKVVYGDNMRASEHTNILNDTPSENFIKRYSEVVTHDQ